MTYVVNKFRKKPTDGLPTEHEEQVKVVVALRKLGKLVFAVPNGGKRGLVEGYRLKAEGVTRGVPDLIIPEPIGQYHGLFIEMKRSKGSSMTDEQEWWATELKLRGYFVATCKGAGAALDVIQAYFGLKLAGDVQSDDMV